jgi:hypothetical protein
MTINSREGHLRSEQIRGWRARSLSGEVALEVSDHVALCAECAFALSAPLTPDSVAASVERCVHSVHEPEEDAPCEVCREQSEDLAAFASVAEKQRRTVAAWTAVAAGIAAAALLAVFAHRSGPAGPQAPGPSSATARVVLRDGPLTIDDHGAVHGIASEWRDRVVRLLLDPRLEPGSSLHLGRAPERQRSEARAASRVHLEEPLSRVVLLDRPELRWNGPPGARYRVEVYGADFSRIARSAVISVPRWTPLEPLPRGSLLTWKVTIVGRGAEVSYPEPPDPPAVFRVATVDDAREVAEAKASGSELIAGLALWRAGLLDDAADAFQRVANANPRSPLAAALARTSRAAVSAAQ